MGSQQSAWSQFSLRNQPLSVFAHPLYGSVQQLLEAVSAIPGKEGDVLAATTAIFEHLERGGDEWRDDMAKLNRLEAQVGAFDLRQQLQLAMQQVQQPNHAADTATVSTATATVSTATAPTPTVSAATQTVRAKKREAGRSLERKKKDAVPAKAGAAKERVEKKNDDAALVVPKREQTVKDGEARKKTEAGPSASTLKRIEKTAAEVETKKRRVEKEKKKPEAIPAARSLKRSEKATKEPVAKKKKIEEKKNKIEEKKKKKEDAPVLRSVKNEATDDEEPSVTRIVKPNPAKKKAASVKCEPKPEPEIAPTPERRSSRSRRDVRVFTPFIPSA